MWKPFLLSVIVALAATVVAMMYLKPERVPVQQNAVDIEAPLTPLYDAPSFALTDMNGNAFTSEQLAGKTYVTMFFFSSCQGVCPGMTTKMVELQDAVKESDVQIVAFTVDPINDTPEKLRAHANDIGANPERWHMLTGTPEQMMEVADGFKLAYDNPVNHSSKFLLIDGKGQVRGFYDSNSSAEVEQLKQDAILIASGA